MRSARLRAFAAALLVLGSSGCGYRVAGKADLLPKSVRTIAVPAFGNASTRYKLSDKLAAQISRELLSRTRYDVVSEPGDADAVLSGSVNNYGVYPTVFDPSTGRASIIQVSVNLSIALRERATNKVIYSRQNFEVRERYEIGTDQRAYVEESDTAMDRLSRDVARSVVSAVLENF